MTRERALRAVSVGLMCLFLALCGRRLSEAAEGKIAVGTDLPGFTLERPDSQEFQKYLGLKGSAPFKVSEISGKLILIDIFNAF